MCATSQEIRTITLAEPGRLVAGRSLTTPQVGAGEALVRVRRVGICGTDLHAFKGEQPFFSYPRVLGHELGVEIVEVGENSEGLQVGDRCAVEPYLNCGECVACRKGKTNCCARLAVLGVHADGGMRERLIVPTRKLHPSALLTLDQLAVVEPLCIGAHAVERAQIEPGEYALVVGAGPIGLSVIQFATIAGAKVIVVDVNERRLDFAREHFGIEHSVLAGEGVAGKLAELTAGEMPTTVFDATGNARSMAAAFDLVAHGGRLVLVGLVQDTISFFDPDAHRRELTMLRSRNATGRDFRRVIGLMESGKVRIDHWITHRVSFGEAAEQFALWLNPQTNFIKALIEV